MLDYEIIVLPKKVINVVGEMKLTRINKNKMYKFFELLLKRSYQYPNKFDADYTPYSYLNYTNLYSNSLNKMFRRDFYGMVIKPLLKLGVIECDNTYSNFKGRIKTKGYRLSKEFFIQEINEDDIGFVKIPMKNTINTHLYKRYRNYINEMSFNCLDENLIKYKEYLNKEKVFNIITDSERIEPKHMSFIINSNTCKLKIENVDLKEGEIIYKENGNCFISNYEVYIKQKRLNCFYNYMNYYIKVKNLYPSVMRSFNNKRLYYPLVYVKNFLLDEIKKDNNLIEVDISNSHSSLLCTLINSEEVDFIKFKDLCSKGLLYEYVKDELNLKDIEVSKDIIYNSFYGLNSSYIKIFKGLFPSVAKWIKEWKTKNGKENEFALMLQKMESTLVIDNLLKKAHRKYKNEIILTRHDSFIVPKEIEEEFIKFLEDNLDDCFNVKVEKHDKHRKI